MLGIEMAPCPYMGPSRERTEDGYVIDRRLSHYPFLAHALPPVRIGDVPQKKRGTLIGASSGDLGMTWSI